MTGIRIMKPICNDFRTTVKIPVAYKYTEINGMRYLKSQSAGIAERVFAEYARVTTDKVMQMDWERCRATMKWAEGCQAQVVNCSIEKEGFYTNRYNVVVELSFFNPEILCEFWKYLNENV